jgi:hypothetical protein
VAHQPVEAPRARQAAQVDPVRARGEALDLDVVARAEVEDVVPEAADQDVIALAPD